MPVDSNRARGRALAGMILGFMGARAVAMIAPEISPPSPTSVDPIEQLTDIMVQGKEPRYVAPTRRDQIGRIWAPVVINGRGPFRLVLDTGASHSGVTATVALALGLRLDQSPPVVMRGVTGFATVPTVKVDTLSVGDLSVDQTLLPIVPDALGGAEGVLGGEGLIGKRIFIDFKHDQIDITYSRNERAARGFIELPFHSMRGTLVVVNATVDGIATRAIIDTGGQATVANLALREALMRKGGIRKGRPDEIQGATKDIQTGELAATPAIEIGTIQIKNSGVTYADMYIFKQWKLTTQPAILIGMDTLGLLDTLIIDYKRHELQLRMAKAE